MTALPIDEIAPAIKRLECPMGRFATVNAWIIGEPGEQAIIDTGTADQSTAALWGQAFSDGTLGGVTDIVCTHMHHDHSGQIPFLMRHTRARLHMTEREHAYLRYRSAQSHDEGKSIMQLYLKRLGVEAVAAGGITPVDYSMLADLASAFEPLRHEQTLSLGGRTWQARFGAGHSQQAALLWSEDTNFLIAGDQILSGSGPLIAIRPDGLDEDPLGDYFAFLDGLRHLPETTLVLPGHGLPFNGLPQHAGAVRRGHERRLGRLLSGLRGAMSCMELVPLVFPSRIRGQVGDLLPGMAMSAVNYLWHGGKVRRHLDDNGIYLFEKN